MKVYLDVSVLIVYLFGQTKEPIRYEAVSNLFDKFQASQLDCCIFLYAFQELYSFCNENYSAPRSDRFYYSSNAGRVSGTYRNFSIALLVSSIT